jgi:hypothetical protein
VALLLVQATVAPATLMVQVTGTLMVQAMETAVQLLLVLVEVLLTVLLPAVLLLVGLPAGNQRRQKMLI